jgi:hypothetical protein
MMIQQAVHLSYIIFIASLMIADNDQTVNPLFAYSYKYCHPIDIFVKISSQPKNKTTHCNILSWRP